MNRSAKEAESPRLRRQRLRWPALRRASAAKMRTTFCSMADGSFTAAVVTVSDSCARGEREDRSGPAVAELLEKLKFSVTAREIVADDTTHIEDTLMRLADVVRLIVTTGGTGIAVRDVTPEAT